MFSPIPRKVGVSCGEGGPVSPRPFWYDDSTLNSLLSQAQGKLLPSWIPAFEGESEASTSAGPSPGPGNAANRLFSLSPSPPRKESFALSSDEEGIIPEKNPRDKGLSEKGAGQQTRKVFVGGVPQSIDQNGLYKMFAKTGKVKKAWLQMFHPNGSEGAGSKHRGFGFVIFADESAVEDLLGKDFSKVIYFGEGIRLEVKRAIGKTVVSSKSFDANANGTAVQACTQAFREQSTSSFSYQKALLPSVPAFPVVQATQVQWPCCNIAEMSMLSPQVMVPSISSSVGWFDQALPDILRDGFVGPKPRNNEELEQVLRQALPDCYED
jgi:hypothetical protein